MTMDENTRAKYEEKIKTLLAMAKKKKNVLEYQEISDHFADLHLEEEQMDEILDALDQARATKGKPSVILAHTVKGKGVPFMENVVVWHGKTPSKEDYEKAMEALA